MSDDPDMATRAIPILNFQSGEDTDRELDCMLELPAARKPLNSPEEVALKSDCGNEI